jgi:hypothetical protein
MSRKATTLSSCNFRFQKLVRKEETETRERERERETDGVENCIGVGFGGYITENTRSCRSNGSRHYFDLKHSLAHKHPKQAVLLSFFLSCEFFRTLVVICLQTVFINFFHIKYCIICGFIIIVYINNILVYVNSLFRLS